MSLSKGLAPNKFMAGKVIMAGRSSATTVAELEGSAKQMAWNNSVEEEYLERVRAKAAARAKEILELAQAEARHIKQQAQEEGYAQGWQKAADEVERVKSDLAANLGSVLAAIQAGGRIVWANHRADVAALVHAATEKMTGLVLAQEAQAMLENMLDRAVDAIGAQRNLLLMVHPEQESLLRDELERAQARYPQLRDWRVRAEPSLEPGGLIVECDEGMVDNSMEGRRARVAEILNMLTLPDDTVDSMDPDDPLLALHYPTQTQAAAAPEAPQQRRDPLRESWERAAAELASEAPRPQPRQQAMADDFSNGEDPFEAAKAAAALQEHAPVAQEAMEPSLHLQEPLQPGSAEAALAAAWEGAAQEMGLLDTAHAPAQPALSGQDATDDLFAQAQAAMAAPEPAPTPAQPAPSGQDATDDLFAQAQAAMAAPEPAPAPAQPAPSGQDATDDLFAQAQAAMAAPEPAPAPAQPETAEPTDSADEAAAAWAKAAEEFNLDDAPADATPVQGQDAADDLFAQAQAAMTSEATPDDTPQAADGASAPEPDGMLAAAKEAAAALTEASEEELPDVGIDPFEAVQHDIDGKDLSELDPFEAAQAALQGKARK